MLHTQKKSIGAPLPPPTMSETVSMCTKASPPHPTPPRHASLYVQWLQHRLIFILNSWPPPYKWERVTVLQSKRFIKTEFFLLTQVAGPTQIGPWTWLGHICLPRATGQEPTLPRWGRAGCGPFCPFRLFYSVVPFVRPFVHPFVRPFVVSFDRPFVVPFVVPFVRPFIVPFVRAFVVPFVVSFVRPFVFLFVVPFVRPFVVPFVRAFVVPFVRPFVWPFVCPFGFFSRS